MTECRPEFPRTARGRRGYEVEAVDVVVAGLVDELAGARADGRELRTEIERLHGYIRDRWEAEARQEEAAGPRGAHVVPAAARAGEVPAAAQQTAERRLAAAAARVAEAERVFGERLDLVEEEAARRLAAADAEAGERLAAAERLAAQRLASADTMADEVLADAGRRADGLLGRARREAGAVLRSARGRYEQVMVRAHERADRAAAVALRDLQQSAARSTDPARAREALELKAAYLRTFAEVSRTALDGVLAPALRDLDVLLGDAAPDGAGQDLVRAEVDPTGGIRVLPTQASPPTTPIRLPRLRATAG